jgi:hypothetical protein
MKKKIKRELRDELEVPGEVLMIKPANVKQMLTECRMILKRAEKEHGAKQLKDIPEGPQKRRLRELLRGLGQDVRF